MPTAFDGSVVPAALARMPCGGAPLFDGDSGYAYRCDQCFAVIGSIGQPQRCKDLNRNPAGASSAVSSKAWRAHDNMGMRHPGESDLVGGETDCCPCVMAHKD